MNNQKNLYLLGAVIVAIAIFVAAFLYGIKPAIENFENSKAEAIQAQSEAENLKKEYETSKAEQQKEEFQMQSIKQIFTSTLDDSSDTGNLGVYGDTFNEVINSIQSNNILIRSIDYKATPQNNVIAQQFGQDYNVCEIKFFVVCKYEQLKAFLRDLAAKSNYLISISGINTVVFEQDTDYVLSNVSLTLYSKKFQDGKAKQRANQPFSKKAPRNEEEPMGGGEED
ncbi:hypothetical protein II906_10405 [bacterium]|nr:hypothetical protein [bacterium]